MKNLLILRVPIVDMLMKNPPYDIGGMTSKSMKACYMAYIKVLKAHATLIIHWSPSLDMYDDLDSLIVVIPLQYSDEVVFRYTKGFKNRQETISFKSFWTLPNMFKVKFCLVLQYQLWVGGHQEPGTSEVARITPPHVKGTFVPHLKEKKKIILIEYVFGFPKDWSSK